MANVIRNTWPPEFQEVGSFEHLCQIQIKRYVCFQIIWYDCTSGVDESLEFVLEDAAEILVKRHTNKEVWIQLCEEDGKMYVHIPDGGDFMYIFVNIQMKIRLVSDTIR